MKLESKRGRVLSLKKNTVAFLNKAQISHLKGGQKATDGGLPQTCGYACGDCMSTLQTLLACVPKPEFL